MACSAGISGTERASAAAGGRSSDSGIVMPQRYAPETATASGCGPPIRRQCDQAAGALGGRFTGDRDPIALTLVRPVVAEISADVATAGGAFRHLVRFIRLRPDLDPRAVVHAS